jgi:RNA polymerase sigma factor (TIGR02999 family)
MTQLLHDWQQGNQHALERLMPLVYDELRRRAAAYMHRERHGHTLAPTGLVHEAVGRLLHHDAPPLQNRSHFFAVVARLMRQVLVDHARARGADKRGAGALRIVLDEAVASTDFATVDVLAVDRALVELRQFDARQADIIELRFFGGMSSVEVAEALDLSPATIKRDWRIARAWLRSRLSG